MTCDPRTALCWNFCGWRNGRLRDTPLRVLLCVFLLLRAALVEHQLCIKLGLLHCICGLHKEEVSVA